MIKYTKDELLLIWLDSFTQSAYHRKRELYYRLKEQDAIKKAVEDLKDYIIESSNEKEYTEILQSANQEYFEKILQNLSKKGITAITIESEYYPEELISTELAPLVLYAKGDVELLREKKFAIVGSRRSLPLSIRLAESYTEGFCKAGFVPVTGIAEGVDSAVIKSALDNGGKCISVVASGFDNIYPKSNENLLKEVEKKGLVISEYPPEVKSRPYFFPIRNRIIAGLCKGTLVISGGMKSGTLHTAGYALEYGRELFAVPYSVGIESGAGCNYLIKHGAYLSEDFSDIAEFYGLAQETKKTDLTDEEKQIVKIISDGETHIDKICEKAEKQTFEILPTLSALEIKGVIVKSGFNCYSLIHTLTEA